jgi:hypothetical protein
MPEQQVRVTENLVNKRRNLAGCSISMGVRAVAEDLAGDIGCGCR